ncbi:alpha/beta-hydrolase [Apiospora hydei]|uniref:Alpha/beta-hydrolase n=1 Tax=Apiospora hydei TaxID=1337664 RepID=A0ABR1X1Q8_9PEZI
MYLPRLLLGRALLSQHPVGDLRFRNPQPINESWDGERAAQKLRPACVGYGPAQWGYELGEAGSLFYILAASGERTGESAGAFSAARHMMASHGREGGLFRAGMMAEGTAFAPKGIDTTGQVRDSLLYSVLGDHERGVR